MGQLKGFTIIADSKEVNLVVVNSSVKDDGSVYHFCECNEKPELRGFYSQKHIEKTATWQDIQ